MPTVATQIPVSNRIELVNTAWNQLKTQLENEKARIYQELGSYPSPIAACDQQFNYLLEEQRRILAELARLNEAAAQSLTAEDPARLIDDFIRSSSCIGPEARQTIRA
jgi:hypothetical protein